MASRATQALTLGFGSVAISMAVGFVLYKIIRTKGKPSTPTGHGRNWMAWMVLFLPLGAYYQAGSLAEVLPVFAILFVIYGGLGFIAGWAYGKLKKPVQGGVDVVKSSLGERVKPKTTKQVGNNLTRTTHFNSSQEPETPKIGRASWRERE